MTNDHFALASMASGRFERTRIWPVPFAAEMRRADVRRACWYWGRACATRSVASRLRGAW